MEDVDGLVEKGEMHVDEEGGTHVILLWIGSGEGQRADDDPLFLLK